MKRRILNLSSKVKVKIDLERDAHHYKKVMSSSEITAGTTLLFVPEGLVEAHFYAMLLLAKHLQESGKPVLMTVCHSLFKMCPSYAMINLAIDAPLEERKSICNKCAKISNQAMERWGIPQVNLNSILTSSERKKIADALKNAPENLMDFSYAGIDFGKLASYELVLLTKMSNFENISGKQKLIWKGLIEDAITSYEQTLKISDHYQVSNVASFNPYASNLGVSAVAIKKNIKFNNISQASICNVDRSQLLVTDYNEYYQLSNNWADFKNLSLPKELILESYFDLINNFSGVGSHRYSPPKASSNNDLIQQLNLPSDRKILVAYTSSEDEVVGYNLMLEALGMETIGKDTACFSTQIEWISEIIKFVENSDQFYLIVRVHPRSGKSRVSDKISNFYYELKEQFHNSYENVFIVWPESSISSYDLAELGDLCLVSWSSIAEDFSRMGMPCLSALKFLPTYPSDSFIESSPSKNAYFERIGEMVNLEPRIDSIQKAFRWFTCHRLATAVKCEDAYPERDYFGEPTYNKNNLFAENLKEILFKGEKASKIYQKKLESIQSADSTVEERKIVIQVLESLLHHFLTGECFDQDQVFNFELNYDLISANKNNVVYLFNNVQYSRYSVMANRIYKILFQCRKDERIAPKA